MAQSNLVNSLFKIDAAEGLVRYTNTIKPFHSKLLDVLVEYVYKEDVKVKVTEKWQTSINQFHTTGGITWDSASQNFTATGSACYFQVINELSTVALTIAGSWEHTWVIQGHHTDKFLPGNRFLVTFDDATSKIFIVSESSITSPTATTVTTLPTIAAYTPTATTIQLAVTPDYRILGATVGDAGAWIIDGDQRDQFQPGETIIVGGPSLTAVSGTVYTIGAPPTLTSPVILSKSIDYTRSYDIIGVTPTSLLPNTLTYVPGTWTIAGQHAQDFPLNTQIVVKNNITTPFTFTVVSATNTPTGTLLTVDTTWDIPVTAIPSGQIYKQNATQYHAARLATIIPVTERVFRQPSTITRPSFSLFDTPPIATPTDIDRDTNNVVYIAQDTGKAYHWDRLRYVEVPIELAYYQAIGTGILRLVPKRFDQIVEPITDVIGAVWINPVTNVSKRWAAAGWIHNYTQTNYAWTDTPSTPSRTVITSADSSTNSFIIQTGSTFTPYAFVTTSTKSNELMFATPYTIVGVNPTANTWIVSGMIAASDLLPGEYIYISDSSASQGLGRYEVSLVSPGPSPNTTSIQVVKQISRLAEGNGILSIPARSFPEAQSTIPNWVEGTRVKLSGTTLPDPLIASQPYYFIPIIKPFHGIDEHGDTVETPATFALSTTRKPRGYDDYVDITTVGSGILTITQDETYVPGSKITVRDSYNNTNDGEYTILQSSSISPTLERVYVTSNVRSSTPANRLHDGVIEYSLDSHLFSGLTEKTCTSREQSQMYAAATVTELIEFTFSVEEFDFITARLQENQPHSDFLRDLGFDIPDFDDPSFDGVVDTAGNMSPMWGGPAYAHSMMQIGFDTQFFDVGGIDETTQTMAGKYGRTVR